MSHNRRQAPADGANGAIVGGGREPDTIIRRHQLKAVVGLSIGHIYALIAAGQFPKPIKLGGPGPRARASGWLSREVEEWQLARKAERDATAGAAPLVRATAPKRGPASSPGSQITAPLET